MSKFTPGATTLSSHNYRIQWSRKVDIRRRKPGNFYVSNFDSGTVSKFGPGYSVNDGNSGNNYIVAKMTVNTTGVINKASLTITAFTTTKTYDASTTAALSPSVSGLSGGDTVTGLAEAYSNANVGTGKTLNISAYTVNDGNGGNNYTVTTVSNTTGEIDIAYLTLTATANTKTYDGSITATATPTVSGLMGNDTMTGLAETYVNANVGPDMTLGANPNAT